ncbi:hypothetical protein [Mycoplasma sp. ATU-Cv-508]|uniref:hypothetical protein n=1 Tax=Mycoplasma sp. ATU-Cv-508 TaxID=2048001 RepID=UPI000FDD9DF3
MVSCKTPWIQWNLNRLETRLNPDDVNQSGKWFEEQRWNQWVKDGVNPEDLTITFGPFSNAFWHTAYLNNYTEYQLAEQFKQISKKWGTKSFDFYFAAPYNTKGSTEFGSSTRLLAGALKILIEQDPSYKVRLSLVTGRDGLNIGVEKGTFNPADGPSRIGDDIYPLYEFTRFLGINFSLNIVTGYIQPTEAAGNDGKLSDEDWEIKALENKMIPNSFHAWKELLKGFAPELVEKGEINDRLINNRMSVTRELEFAAKKLLTTLGPRTLSNCVS